MIRIERGAEPESLRGARRWRLARAVLAGGSVGSAALDGYDTQEVRATLYAAQHEKCAYCEMQVQDAGQPVEHFRPRAYAIRSVTGPGPEDMDRYWWLAWTWENMLFACVSCNSKGRKGNRFPLAPGAAGCALGPASARQAPGIPVDEAAQLIDPAREDPMDSIVFVREGDDWVPTGRRGSTRGQDTVKLLRLDDADALRRKYRTHVGQVKHHIEAIERAVEAGDEATVRARWTRAVASFVKTPDMPHRALSHDLLDASFDADVRARFDLRLPRPGAGWAASPPSTDAPLVGLDGLPDDVVWKVRAVGPPQSIGYRQALDEGLAALCAHGRWTAVELACLVGCSVASVEDGLKRLCEDGGVTESDGRFSG